MGKTQLIRVDEIRVGQVQHDQGPKLRKKKRERKKESAWNLDRCKPMGAQGHKKSPRGSSPGVP
jgi:ribosomal protein L37AE/L43A